MKSLVFKEKSKELLNELNFLMIKERKRENKSLMCLMMKFSKIRKSN